MRNKNVLQKNFELLFNKIVNDLSPEKEKATTVFLAGQPGSGKSRLSEFVKNSLFNGNVFILDIDDLRKLHPLYFKTIQNPKKDLYSLDVDLRPFRKELIDKLHKYKYNYIIDGTLGGKIDYIRFDAINAKKYNNVQLNVLSVNEFVSKLGFVSRFEESLKNKGYGRNVDFSYHDEIYKNIPKNIELLIKDNLLDSINVFAKNYTKTHSLYYTSFKKNNLNDALVVFKKFRNISFQSEEFTNLKNWMNNIKKLRKNRNAKFLPLIAKFKKQVEPNSTIKKQISQMANSLKVKRKL